MFNVLKNTINDRAGNKSRIAGLGREKKVKSMGYKRAGKGPQCTRR